MLHFTWHSFCHIIWHFIGYLARPGGVVSSGRACHNWLQQGQGISCYNRPSPGKWEKRGLLALGLPHQISFMASRLCREPPRETNPHSPEPTGPLVNVLGPVPPFPVATLFFGVAGIGTASDGKSIQVRA